jgi:sugar phosphate isomerase/epimerase
MPQPGLAVQLYTLRDRLAEDLDGTLTALAAAGAQTVELAGLYTRSPADMRNALHAAGLTPCAAHVPLTRVETEPGVVLNELDVLGIGTLVIPSVPAPADAAAADMLIARMEAVAEIAGRGGLRTAYHNHDFEFLALDDGTDLWRRITAEGRPWALEPDVGWLRVAGHDPVEVLSGLGGRFPLVHAKDVRPSGPEWHDVPVGDGILDWPAIVAAATEAGAEHIVVEMDHPSPDAIGDVARSLDAMRRVLAPAS